MSWLSSAIKKVGGGSNMTKLAAIGAAGYFGGQFLWGAKMTPTGFYAYDTDTLAGSMFTKYGVTPFQATKFGESGLGRAISKVGRVGSFLGDIRESAVEVSEFMRAGPQPGVMPVAGGSQGFRGDLRFQSGRANMIPIGRGGQVLTALEDQNNRQYFAKKVAMMGMPSLTRLPTAGSVGAGGLEETTSAKRRAYKGLVSS